MGRLVGRYFLLRRCCRTNWHRSHWKYRTGLHHSKSEPSPQRRCDHVSRMLGHRDRSNAKSVGRNLNRNFGDQRIVFGSVAFSSHWFVRCTRPSCFNRVLPTACRLSLADSVRVFVGNHCSDRSLCKTPLPHPAPLKTTNEPSQLLVSQIGLACSPSKIDRAAPGRHLSFACSIFRLSSERKPPLSHLLFQLP